MTGRNGLAGQPLPAPWSGALRAAGSCPIPRRSPPWRSGSPRSAPARAPELVWLLEHPPLYTAGTSARPATCSTPDRFPCPPGRARRPVHLSRARPARRLCDARPRAARAATCAPMSQDLEDWLIAHPRPLRRARRAAARPRRHLGGRAAAAREDKIAAIGVRVRRWVTYHGVSLNRRPRPVAFRGHRALRHRRPPASPRWRSSACGSARRARPRAGRGIRGGVRPVELTK